VFNDFFKRRKYCAIAFGEIEVHWTNSTFTVFSIIFFENDNNKRKWTVSGGGSGRNFHNTQYYAPCQTWKHTGLLPEWAKDPLAEKLMR